MMALGRSNGNYEAAAARRLSKPRKPTAGVLDETIEASVAAGSISRVWDSEVTESTVGSG
jgi:hypothetical protein